METTRTDARQQQRDEATPVRWVYPVAVGIPLIVLNCGWIAHSEMKTGVTEITITTLFMGVTFLLFVISLLNLAVRRLLGPRAAMNQPEFMALFTMLSLSSAIAGIGNLGFFLPFLGNAFWFSESNAEWNAFPPLLPSYIGPRDRNILKGFYEGRSTFFQADVMAAWALPLIFWGVFYLILLWTLLCAASVLRRRWEDEEHLPFPVVALPLEMTREAAPLYRNRLLWLGFAVPFCLHSLNTLHGLYPSLPSFPINKSQQMLANVPYPWNGLGSVLLLVHPCGVGFGYLVNVDMLFSLWFFYALKKLLNLFGTMMNWRDPGPNEYGDSSPEFPYTGYQAWGAWLTVAFAALWMGRPYFKAYWNRVFEGDPEGLDRREPMSARFAVIGFVGGFLALCACAWLSGASLWVPVAFLGMYILLMIALSRLEAETAVLSPLLGWVDPQSILTGVAGANAFSKTDLAHMATLSWFNLDYRAAPMPQQLQGFVGMRRAGGALRPLVAVMMIASVVAIVSALLWDMQLYYTNGAATANVNGYRVNMGKAPWWKLQGWLTNPRPPEAAAAGGMAVGAGITFLLSFLRSRFIGFPLSPAAYLLNLSWANELFWLDLFIAWLVKASFLRYGGMRLYTAALPFFLGLILGDFVTGSFWSLVGMLLRVDMYRTFPN